MLELLRRLVVTATNRLLTFVNNSFTIGLSLDDVSVKVYTRLTSGLTAGCLHNLSPGHSQVTPRSLPGHSRVTPGSLPGHSQVTPWSLPGHSQVTPGSLPGHSRVTPRSLPGHSQVTLGSLPGHPRVTPRSLPGHSRVTPGSLPGHSRVTSPPRCVFYNYMVCDFSEWFIKVKSSLF